MTSFGSQPVHPSSRLPIRVHSSSATRFPSASSSSTTNNNSGPVSPSLVRRPTTATSNSTTTSTSQVGDIPLSNRASILDHTHAVNNTVDLTSVPTPAAASRVYTSNATTTTTMNDDLPSSSRFDTSSTTNGGNSKIVGGSSRLSVRRALGQRAESESIAALRRGANRQGSANKHRTLSSHFDDSHDNDDVVRQAAKRASVDGRAMSSASQSSRTPFATVKRIFRSRSKSQSNPKNNASVVAAPRGETHATSVVIDAVPAIPPSLTSPALMSTQASVRRQSKDNNRATSSLFSFGRARSPPTRAKSTSSRLSTADSGSMLTVKRQPAKSFTSSIASPPPATNYGAEGGRDDDGVAGTSSSPPPAKRERKISGLPASSSDGHSLAFGFSRSRTDRSLTLQSLSGTSSPPYGVRRSSLSSNGHLSPRFATLEAPPTPRTDGTPTPTTAYFPRGSTVGAGERGGVDAIAKQTAPDTSVPKIWQLARPLRTSTIDESPVRNNSQQGRRQESSTTSGSALSFRTAQSYADEDSTSPPELPRLSMDNIAPRRSAGMLDAITSIPRSAASPLTDLIENLEQRMSSSSTGASTPTRDTVARRAIPTATNASTPLSVQFPTRPMQQGHTLDDEDALDEDESTFSRISVSSSSRTPSPSNVRRNTFGNDLMRAATEQSEHDTETNGQYWDRTTHAVDGGGGANVSMHDIENSLAAVEAALQDHRRAGSMDPNLLLQHIAPRSAGAADTSRNSFVQQFESEPGEIDEQETPLARVTIPPEQQYAIANAVKQVRRAISSSQLPQIPNEDDSDVSRSPLTEFAPALVTSGTSKSELLAIPAQQRKGSGTSHDSTPIRAARIRQESMQDVEQAYARMVELVSSAAGIELIPSPLPAARSYVRRPTQSQPSSRVSAAFESPSNASQYVRERTQSAAPTPFLTPSAMQVWTSYSPRQDVPPLPAVSNTNTPAAAPTAAASSTRATRQQLLRESDALSRVIGPLPDLSEETLEQQSKHNTEESLRGRTSNVSLGSRRAMSSSPQARYYRDTIDVDGASTTTAAAFVARAGQSPSRADSGGMHTASGTSPSIAAKTQGSAYAAQAEITRQQQQQPAAMASVFYPASHNRSASAQNVYEWQQNRSRYSSPASARVTQQQVNAAAAAANAAKRISIGSNDVPRSSSEIHRQIADELAAQRRMRVAAHHLSGSSAGIPLNEARMSPEQIASVFGSAAGSTAQHATDSGGTGSYRRSGSVRDWGRMEDVTSLTGGVGGGGGSVRPSSNLSGGGGMMYKNTHVVRKSDGSDLSDPVRLAFLNQRMASPASSSVIAMQQRHALERDSLLDMLDRTRSEAHELGTRNEHLRADLHLEVTRVLELERECERRKQNEQQLARRVQALEQELKVEQADRVRIGELLERVQRAVDEAANARSGGGGGSVSVSGTAGAGMDSGESGEVVSSADDRFDQHVGSRILDVDDETDDNVLHVAGILDAHRQRDTSSPTSSSVSIRQEDLLPIKTRIFDVSGTVDDQELLHGLTSTTSAGGAVLQEHSIFDLYGHNSRDSTPLNRHENAASSSSSPSLDSHASQLGLTFDRGEQDWSLDEEVLPDVIQSEIVQQPPTTPQSRRASSQQSVPHTPLRHVAKRSPVVDNFGASLGGSSSSSSLTKKRRFPSLTLAGQSDRARTLSNDDPPTPSASPRSARQASHSSRTTAADTSAFTSPAGSHVPAFAAAASRKVTPNAVVVPSRIPSMQSKRASVDTKAYAAMMQSRIPQMISAATAAKPALQNEPITSSSVAMRNVDSADSYYDHLNNAGGAASLLRIRSNEQE